MARHRSHFAGKAKDEARPGACCVRACEICCLHSHTAGDEGFFVGCSGVNRVGPQRAVISGLVS